MLLISDCNVLLLDEPLAGVDKIESDFIVNIICELSKSKLILLVEHDIEVVLNISNSVSVMNNGQLIIFSDPKSVKNNTLVNQIFLIKLMKNNKLEIKKLNSYYGSSHILKNISFSLEENKVLSIVGKNGMGKTTLLNSLMGIVEKIEGTIFFQNKLISKLETQSLMSLGIAYIPDHRGIFKNLTVNENLELLNKKKSKWDKSRVLDYFPQLKNKLNNYGDQISGGSNKC